MPFGCAFLLLVSTFSIPLGGNKNDFIVWQLVFFLARYKIVSSQFLTYRFLYVMKRFVLVSLCFLTMSRTIHCTGYTGTKTAP